MKKKKILITGSSGFIGSNLLPLLKRQGHLVMEFDLKMGYDLFEPDKLEYGVSVADVVIHLAAQVSVGKSFINPNETFKVNVLGTAKVIELCIKYKKKLIFPSSASVIYPELSPYAKSKKYAEDLAIEAINSIPVTILRFYNVYGYGMNADSGSIMYRFLNDKKIIVYGDGEQTRDYINVKDVVNIIVNAIDKEWDGKIVDVGLGQAHTANYIAGLFAFYRKLTIHYEAPKREIKWSIADTYLLKQLYKKPLLTNLKEDIKQLCSQR